MTQDTNSLLQVKDLAVSFRTDEGTTPVLHGLSYTLSKGRILAVVGESGSGKTVHALSLLRLLPPTAQIDGGQILFNGQNICHMENKKLRDLRGAKMAMIFQDPSASLNPVLTIGEQLTETILAHKKITPQQAREEAVKLLQEVGIREAEKRLNEYPFQFSGGMCQRVMIAMALALHPEVLIADEPTTALDVTIQAQILKLMRDLQRKNNMSAVFITHNLAVVAGIADDVLVLYGGLCMEQAPVKDLFARPLHPYTQGLLKSLVSVDKKEEKLPAIEGHPPVPGQIKKGCPFAPRCEKATKKCFEECPPLFEKGARKVRCWLEENA